MQKYVAEFFGTFWLVLGGCGSAVLAATFPEVGIGLVGVSIAFGLTVLTMAYAIGHISGCHLNPAVSFGLWTSGRFSTAELLPYIVAQVAGGLAGAAISAWYGSILSSCTPATASCRAACLSCKSLSPLGLGLMLIA